MYDDMGSLAEFLIGGCLTVLKMKEHSPQVGSPGLGVTKIAKIR